MGTEKEEKATFCAHCDYISEAGEKTCATCSQEMHPVTPAHRQSNVVLLSGIGAARVWDDTPEHSTTDVVEEYLREHGRLEE